MGWALLVLILVSFLIGYQAQTVKGRSGIGWGILTLCVLLLLFAWAWPDQRTVSQSQNPETLMQAINALGQAGFAAFMATIVGGILMGLIVTLLPKLATRVCPFCAEKIQDQAVICPHCRKDLDAPKPAAQAGSEWL